MRHTTRNDQLLSPKYIQGDSDAHAYLFSLEYHVA